jgi:hypothetical protein
MVGGVFAGGGVLAGAVTWIEKAGSSAIAWPSATLMVID